MFDPRIQLDHGEYDDTHGRSFADKEDTVRFGIGSRNFWCSDQEVVVQLRLRANQEDTMGSDDSGFCSPPLWKNSPSPQRSSSSSQPLLSHPTLSPNSRLQAITRGQRELMEMVRNLPESSYELSLKDLVEHHQMQTQGSPFMEGLGGSNRQGGGGGGLQQQQRGEGVVRIKRQGSKEGVRRSGSFEIENKGMFLKMGFPFSLQRKKRNKFAGNGSGKVSPKPEVLKANSGGERDWWKKKFTGSSDSDSSRTSYNSGSSGSSGSTASISSGHSNDSSRKKNRRFLSSCWTIFQCRRSKYED